MFAKKNRGSSNISTLLCSLLFILVIKNCFHNSINKLQLLIRGTAHFFYVLRHIFRVKLRHSCFQLRLLCRRIRIMYDDFYEPAPFPFNNSFYVTPSLSYDFDLINNNTLKVAKRNCFLKKVQKELLPSGLRTNYIMEI